MSESPNVNTSYETATGKVRESFEKTAKAGQSAAEKAVKAGKETAEKAFAAGSETMSKAYDQAFGVAKDAIHKTFPQAAAQFDELAAFQCANLEAMTAAGSIAMKGVEAISAQLVAFNTKVMEDGVANAQKLWACKT
ncbi:MAG: phasin family protein, partial [Alphaproteobacteria bacterium]